MSRNLFAAPGKAVRLPLYRVVGLFEFHPCSLRIWHTLDGLMTGKSVQLGEGVGRRCPCFGVLCFLCAFVSSLFGAKSASADTPPTAIKTTSLAVPATVLGVTNPYLVAAAMKTPEVRGFTLSQDIRDLAAQVERLARYGVDLNQRKMPHAEKLQLRVDTRTHGVGGILQLRYRR